MKLVKVLFLSTLLVLTVAALAAPSTPAQAGPTALGVGGVSPSLVVNTQAHVLTISGTEFVSGAVVSLDGGGDLITTFISSTSLSAALPVNFPIGTYTVRVTNPDLTSAALPNGLRVAAPTTDPDPTSTPANPAYERPLMVIDSYVTSANRLQIGTQFNLSIKLRNAGQVRANNVVVTFTPGDLIPRETGGLVALGEVASGTTKEFGQPMTVSNGVFSSVLSLTMTVTYSDQVGNAYTDSFALTFNLFIPNVVRPNTPTPTPTLMPTQVLRPQLVITSYGVSVEKLQPGTQFTLQIKVKNMGSADAHRVTMIAGGGSMGSSGGTPDSGGTNGGTSDFTNFAPLGSSNIQSLGEMPTGEELVAEQSLIVNVTTNPGAYPFKVTFSYTSDNNIVYNDEQVITLLVFTVPSLEINFYQPAGVMFTGQPNLLPLQVVNLGRRSAVLGNMRVESASGMLENATILVGTLDTGGYFTLDATFYPDVPGMAEITVYLDYTDDFNQLQTVSKTLTLEVMEGYIPPPEGEGEGGFPIEPVDTPETFWQKVWRFILGLLGLDSGKPTEQPGILPEVMPEDVPIVEPKPVVPGKG